MIDAIEHKADPITAMVTNADGIEAELAAFNKEALAILKEGEDIRPESAAFADAGLRIEKCLDAGLENLNPQELGQFVAGLNEMQAWRAHFEPRVNALLERQARHLAHEKDLMARLKEQNLLVQLVHTFSAN